MKNTINVDKPIIENNIIKYKYEIKGEWQEAFNEDETFFIEYSHDISKTPDDLLIIPFLCNILPIAWIYNAEIFVDSCDADFFENINKIKDGYKEMYPMVKFEGEIHVNNIVRHRIENSGAIAFFSGGVDAFGTLVSHMNEKPTLLTIWGADIDFTDKIGWDRVFSHVKQTAKDFQIDYVIVKSSFRRFLNAGALSKKISYTGEGWWHGFQHGIGLIGHSAPIAYSLNKKVVYIASSFSNKMKGLYTCASDPIIDNNVKFSNSYVLHDGYENDRQDKIHNIVQCSKNMNIPITLRVCWETSGGENCCRCEKCLRTMIGIYAEKAEPKDFGFICSESEFDKNVKMLKRIDLIDYLKLLYKQIQISMIKNCNIEDIPKSLKWFYEMDINKIGNHPIYNIYYKIKRRFKKYL